MKKVKLVDGNQRILLTGGKALVSALLEKSNIKGRLDGIRLRSGEQPYISSGEVAIACLGMMCRGECDFKIIRMMQGDPEYYQMVLGIQNIPSPGTARQRIDASKDIWHEAIRRSNVDLLRRTGMRPTPYEDGWVPLDVDVTLLDNSGSHKEGVSRTYKGYNGYAPIMAYLGTEGYLVNTELRERKIHCQNGTTAFLERSIELSRRVCQQPLLVRMDSGNDSAENLRMFQRVQVDFIVNASWDDGVQHAAPHRPNEPDGAEGRVRATAACSPTAIAHDHTEPDRHGRGGFVACGAVGDEPGKGQPLAGMLPARLWMFGGCMTRSEGTRYEFLRGTHCYAAWFVMALNGKRM